MSNVSVLDKENKVHRGSSPEPDDDDPGLIFKLAEPTQVHDCMAMSSVANIVPPLKQGATPADSMANLYTWLDNFAESLNLKEDKFAKGCRGQRLWGMFHHLKSEEERRFCGQLHTALEGWGVEVEASGTTVGTILVIGSDPGKGLYIHEVPMRPFKGL